MNGFLALVAGSVAGGLSRFVLSSAIQRVNVTSFPAGTLAVNVAGCLIIGFISSAGGVRFNMSQEVRLLLVTGFCGAFTTFSALILETVDLAKAGNPGLGAAYVALSIGLGLLAFFAGAALGRMLA